MQWLRTDWLSTNVTCNAQKTAFASFAWGDSSGFSFTMRLLHEPDTSLFSSCTLYGRLLGAVLPVNFNCLLKPSKPNMPPSRLLSLRSHNHDRFFGRPSTSVSIQMTQPSHNTNLCWSSVLFIVYVMWLKSYTTPILTRSRQMMYPLSVPLRNRPFSLLQSYLDATTWNSVWQDFLMKSQIKLLPLGVLLWMLMSGIQHWPLIDASLLNKL